MAFGFNLGQGRRANVFTDTVSIYVFFGSRTLGARRGTDVRRRTTEQVGPAAIVFDPMENRVLIHNPRVVYLGSIPAQSRRRND